MTKKPPPPSGSLGSLGDLLRARGVPASEAPAEPEPAAAPVPTPASSGDSTPELVRAGRLIVRRERKGHGGKAVTVVDGLELPDAALEALARTMRKALGCGSWVDAGRVLLQGDRADAVAIWLTRHGARDVRRAN